MSLDPNLLDYVLAAAIEKKREDGKAALEAYTNRHAEIENKLSGARNIYDVNESVYYDKVIEEMETILIKKYKGQIIPSLLDHLRQAGFKLPKRFSLYVDDWDETCDTLRKFRFVIYVQCGDFTANFTEEVSLMEYFKKYDAKRLEKLKEIEVKCNKEFKALQKVKVFREPTATQKAKLAAKLLGTKNVDEAIRKAVDLL